MNIEPNLVLNQTNFKSLWKWLKSKVFEIQKNGLKIGLKILLKNKKIIRTKISGSFEINNKKTLIY